MNSCPLTSVFPLRIWLQVMSTDFAVVDARVPATASSVSDLLPMIPMDYDAANRAVSFGSITGHRSNALIWLMAQPIIRQWRSVPTNFFYRVCNEVSGVSASINVCDVDSLPDLSCADAVFRSKFNVPVASVFRSRQFVETMLFENAIVASNFMVTGGCVEVLMLRLNPLVDDITRREVDRLRDNDSSSDDESEPDDESGAQDPWESCDEEEVAHWDASYGSTTTATIQFGTLNLDGVSFDSVTLPVAVCGKTQVPEVSEPKKIVPIPVPKREMEFEGEFIRIGSVKIPSPPSRAGLYARSNRITSGRSAYEAALDDLDWVDIGKKTSERKSPLRILRAKLRCAAACGPSKRRPNAVRPGARMDRLVPEDSQKVPRSPGDKIQRLSVEEYERIDAVYRNAIAKVDQVVPRPVIGRMLKRRLGKMRTELRNAARDEKHEKLQEQSLLNSTTLGILGGAVAGVVGAAAYNYATTPKQPTAMSEVTTMFRQIFGGETPTLVDVVATFGRGLLSVFQMAFKAIEDIRKDLGLPEYLFYPVVCLIAFGVVSLNPESNLAWAILVITLLRSGWVLTHMTDQCTEMGVRMLRQMAGQVLRLQSSGAEIAECVSLVITGACGLASLKAPVKLIRLVADFPRFSHGCVEITKAFSHWGEVIVATIREYVLGQPGAIAKAMSNPLSAEYLKNATSWLDMHNRDKKPTFVKYHMLKDLIRLGDQLVFSREFKELSISHQNYVINTIKTLRDAMSDFDAYENDAISRIEPVVLYLYGQPGVGKSVAIQLLTAAVTALACGEISPEQYATNREAFMYVKKQETEFDVNYRQQVVSVMDDIGQRADVPGGKSEYATLIDWANPFPCPMHMAALDDKNGTYMTSWFIFLTANWGAPNPESIISKPALWRRLHFTFQVYVNPEFAVNPNDPNPENWRFDYPKMASLTPENAWKPYIFRRYEILADGSMRMTDDAYTLKEVAVLLYQKHQSHIVVKENIHQGCVSLFKDIRTNPPTPLPYERVLPQRTMEQGGRGFFRRCEDKDTKIFKDPKDESFRQNASAKSLIEQYLGEMDQKRQEELLQSDELRRDFPNQDEDRPADVPQGPGWGAWLRFLLIIVIYFLINFMIGFCLGAGQYIGFDLLQNKWKWASIWRSIKAVPKRVYDATFGRVATVAIKAKNWLNSWYEEERRRVFDDTTLTRPRVSALVLNNTDSELDDEVRELITDIQRLRDPVEVALMLQRCGLICMDGGITAPLHLTADSWMLLFHFAKMRDYKVAAGLSCVVPPMRGALLVALWAKGVAKPDGSFLSAYERINFEIPHNVRCPPLCDDVFSVTDAVAQALFLNQVNRSQRINVEELFLSTWVDGEEKSAIAIAEMREALTNPNITFMEVVLHRLSALARFFTSTKMTIILGITGVIIIGAKIRKAWKRSKQGDIGPTQTLTEQSERRDSLKMQAKKKKLPKRQVKVGPKSAPLVAQSVDLNSVRAMYKSTYNLYARNGDARMIFGRAFCVKSCYFVTARHVLREITGAVKYYATVEVENVHSGQSFEIPVEDMVQCYNDAPAMGDFVVFRRLHGPTPFGKDRTNSLCDEIFVPQSKQFAGFGNRFTADGECILFQQQVLVNDVGGHAEYAAAMNSEGNESGRPLFSMYKGKAMFVGVLKGLRGSGSVYEPVSRQMVERGVAYVDSLTDDPIPEDSTVTLARELDADEAELVEQSVPLATGLVAQGFTVPHHTKLVKSPICDFLKRRPNCAPAAMDWYVKDGVLKHPLYESYIERPLRAHALDTDAAYECAKHIIAKSTRFVRTSLDPDVVSTNFCRMLTFEEAVCGWKNGLFNSIPRGTSPGYPFILDPEIMAAGGKRYFFGSGGDFNLTNPHAVRLQEMCQELLVQLNSGRRVEAYNSVYLKDELRSFEKVEQRKTRVIECANLALLIVTRMLFGGFAAYMQVARVENGSAIGVDPSGPEWTDIAQHIQRYRKAFCGDGAGWDKKTSIDLFWAVLKASCDFYSDEWRQARWTCGHEFLYSRKLVACPMRPRPSSEAGKLYDQLPENHLYRRAEAIVVETLAGMAPGSFLTALFNTLGMIVLAMLGYSYAVGYLDLDTIDQNLYVIALGDDHVVATNDPRFTALTFRQFWLSIGMDYTGADKEPVTYEYQDFNDLDFLKRKFVFMPPGGKLGLAWRGGFVAPLALDSIYRSLWYRRENVTLEDFRLILANDLNELSAHGESVYDEVVGDIRGAWKKKFPADPFLWPKWADAFLRSRETGQAL